MADGAVLLELNRDIWQEFCRAYAACDAPAFLAVHSPELIRAGGPEKQAHGFEEYAEQTRQWFAEVTSRGDRIGIEFRFLERIASPERASERGIYRITLHTGGEERIFHGQFHTFARKEDGRWRIAVDYDSTEGGTITAETFAAATDPDDVEAFAG